MPAKCLMNWDAKNRRWRKFYKGRQISPVSCNQLSAWCGRPVPETKEGSYQTANAWWIEKKAEIDGQVPPNPHAEEIVELRKRRDWLLHHAVDDDDRSHARWLGGMADFLQEYPGARSYLFDRHVDELMKIKERYGIDTSRVPMHVFRTEEAIWAERFSYWQAAPTPEDRSVGGQVERFLELERGRVDAGQMSPSEYDQMRRCLNHFRDWVGADWPVDKIDADKWESYWLHLIQAGGSLEYRKKKLRHARNFLGWLASKGVVSAPPNLNSRKHRFKGAARAVPTLTVEEVRGLVDAARGPLRLYLLLMANCGMTQMDVSDLRRAEVDLDAGRIIRKRSKTADERNVPVVNYKLWPETLAVLREHCVDVGEYALLTKAGGRLLDDRMEGDKRRKRDSIGSGYKRLKSVLGFKKPLKLLRKTSASLLDDHEVYGRYTGHFLGHSPRSMRDKHYVTPSQDRFDEAVDWLGRRYGFVPDES